MKVGTEFLQFYVLDFIYYRETPCHIVMHVKWFKIRKMTK